MLNNKKNITYGPFIQFYENYTWEFINIFALKAEFQQCCVTLAIPLVQKKKITAEKLMCKQY